MSSPPDTEGKSSSEDLSDVSHVSGTEEDHSSTGSSSSDASSSDDSSGSNEEGDFASNKGLNFDSDYDKEGGNSASDNEVASDDEAISTDEDESRSIEPKLTISREERGRLYRSLKALKQKYKEEVESEVLPTLIARGKEAINDSDLDLGKVVTQEYLTPKDKVVTKSKIRHEERSYNARYARIYSQELHEYASGCPENIDKYSLPYSRVNTTGSVDTETLFPLYEDSAQSTNDYGRELLANDTLEAGHVAGSFWAIDEKERFFTFLGRRSRHNMLGVAQGVRTKSVVECEEYFNLLQRMTEEYLNNNPLERVHKGIAMKEIPTAWEMSEEWIAMEEKQAQSMQAWERHKTVIKRGSKEIQRRVNPKTYVCNPMFRRIYKESPVVNLDTDMDTTDSLINIKQLFHLSSMIFRHAPYDEVTFPSESGQKLMQLLELDLLGEMEEMIEDTVRCIVRQVLATITGSKSRVGKKDVHRALIEHGYPISSKTYWQQYPRRTRTVFKEFIAADSDDSYYDKVEQALSVENAPKFEYNMRELNKLDIVQPEEDNPKKLNGSRYETFDEVLEKDKEKELKLTNAVDDKWYKAFASQIEETSSTGSSGSENDSNIDTSSTNEADEESSDNSSSDCSADMELDNLFFLGPEPDDINLFPASVSSSSNSDIENASPDSDSEDGFNISWQVKQAQIREKMKHKELSDEEEEQMLIYQEEKELEEYDHKSSVDNEYITLVWLNTGSRSVVTEDKNEALMRIAEVPIFKGEKYKDSVRVLGSNQVEDCLNYNIKKRMIDEIEKEEKEGDGGAAKRVRLQEQRFQELERYRDKLSPVYLAAFLRRYEIFSSTFPKQGTDGILRKKISSRYKA